MSNDGYASCAYCQWVGKARADGSVRKHRQSTDAGRTSAAGGLPQDMNAPICKGSGQQPWDWTPPQGGHQVTSR